ncbi:MAG: hypothetical protein AAB728_05205 [Patescibacteria group bacterium]
MLQKLRESLTLVVLALLPFHALLVTAGTRLLQGPGHAPMAALALWKEGVLGVILVLAVLEFVVQWIRRRRVVCHPSTELGMTRPHLLDWLIVSLIVLGIVVSVFNGVPRGEFLLGAKYDLVPLVAFLILRRVEWSAWFRALLLKTVIAVGSVVALLGVASLFLPIRFFTFLGYADLHSLYDPAGPLAPFHQIGESWVRRVQSTMSGPNQLGVWLLLPLGVCLVSVLSDARILGIQGNQRNRGNVGNLSLRFLRMHRFLWFLLIAIALLLTFSRAAWIGAFVMAVVTLARILPKRIFKKAFVGILGTLGILGVTVTLLFPSVFFRLSSSRGHLTRPLQAMGVMVRHPLGQGLGSAGPATNRNREPCVFLRPQDDPSWAKSQPQLCVFLGATQVQPSDHACNCPFLPENWYLQIGVELGVLGFALFIALAFIILQSLGAFSFQLSAARNAVLTAGRPFGPAGLSSIPSLGAEGRASNGLPLTALFFFLGVSIAALFLHAWEDAAVAYSGWVLAAVALRKPQ